MTDEQAESNAVPEVESGDLPADILAGTGPHSINDRFPALANRR